MKRIIVCFALLLVCGSAFAKTSTSLGEIALTENQILNWQPSAPWERFSYINGEVIAISDAEPTEAQKNALKAELQALPDTVPVRIIMDQFNTDFAIAVINAQLSVGARIRFVPYLAALKDYMNYRFEDGTRNFRDMKLMCDALVVIGTLTAEEYVIIKAALSAQNINLDEF